MNEEIKLNDCQLCGAEAEFKISDDDFLWIVCTGCQANMSCRLPSEELSMSVLARFWNSPISEEEKGRAA
ncbi:hypothetical protein ACJJIL_17930 [Microbulbifer sp. EKSA005]|uniref:hypothetical protein n=1 Tax=Microbulbifer sp. EKSA005 TaxID=3243364 RepID=UPI004040F3F8